MPHFDLYIDGERMDGYVRERRPYASWERVRRARPWAIPRHLRPEVHA